MTRGREALLAALDTGARFRPFASDLAQHFDLSREQTLALLEAIDDAARWVPGPTRGVRLMHVQGGPNIVAPDAGFVHVRPGFRIPTHRHHTPEISYVLAGSLRDGEGQIRIPGEAFVMEPGTQHELQGDPYCETLFAVVMGVAEFVPG